jgi:hypothetical protein
MPGPKRATSHSRTILSCDQDKVGPSTLSNTAPWTPSCFIAAPRGFPVVGSHSRTVPSRNHDRMQDSALSNTSQNSPAYDAK